MKKLLALLCALLTPLCARAAAPERVVCLYGSYAEAWMQAGGTLVGVTEDAVKERGMATDAAIVGTTKTADVEAIVALDPDWVIFSEDIAQQGGARETLEGMGIPCSAYRVDSFADYAAMMDDFTRKTGRRDLYDALIPPMRARIDEIIQKAQAQAAPRVLLLRAYSTGVKAKGGDNLAGVMLRDLGCENLVDAHPSLLEELSLETIVMEDPDWIFVSVMGGSEEAALASLDATLGQNPAYQALTAVKNGRVQVLPKDLFHYKPNARWGESYAYLYERLFP